MVAKKRKDIVLKAEASTGVTRFFYRVLALGSTNISEGARRMDERVG